MKNKSSVKIPGLSFSWKRALGITQAKQNFSRKQAFRLLKVDLKGK